MGFLTETDQPSAFKRESEIPLPPSDFSFLQSMLRIALDRRALLWKAALIGGAIGIVLSIVFPSYKSTSSLMPPTGDSSARLLMSGLAGGQGGGGADLLGAIASEKLGIKSPGALFIGILESRAIRDRLITRFDLRKVYWVRTWAAARKELAGRTQVAEDRKSGIINISVSDRSRTRAAALNQAYVDELNRIVIESTVSSARKEREFLEQRLASLKVQLDKDAAQLSQFSSASGAIDIPQQGKALLEAGASIEGELIAAKAQLKGLEAIYSSNNIRVQSLRARIDVLQTELQQMAAAKNDGTDSDYPGLRKLPILAARYADYYRQVKVDEAVYEALTKEYELAKVQEAKDTPTVKLLDPPEIPEKKSSPSAMVSMLLGAICGCFVLMAWLLGRERWTRISDDHPVKLTFQEVYRDLHSSRIWRRASAKQNRT